MPELHGSQANTEVWARWIQSQTDGLLQVNLYEQMHKHEEETDTDHGTTIAEYQMHQR